MRTFQEHEFNHEASRVIVTLSGVLALNGGVKCVETVIKSGMSHNLDVHHRWRDIENTTFNRRHMMVLHAPALYRL